MGALRLRTRPVVPSARTSVGLCVQQLCGAAREEIAARISPLAAAAPQPTKINPGRPMQMHGRAKINPGQADAGQADARTVALDAQS